MSNVIPIFKRELRAYFDSPIAYVVITVFLLVTGYFFSDNLFKIAQADMQVTFSIIPFIFIFILPAISMRLISEERKNGTMELLLTMPISDPALVIGKFLAAVTLLACMILPTVIYAISLSFLGDIDFGAVVAGYFGLLLIGAVYLAVGIFISCQTENQIVAFIISWFVMFGMFMLDKILYSIPSGAVNAVEYASIGYHFQNFARGVIDTRDLIFYLSTIGLYLLLATCDIRNVFIKIPKNALITLGAFAAVYLICNLLVAFDLTEESPGIIAIILTIVGLLSLTGVSILLIGIWLWRQKRRAGWWSVFAVILVLLNLNVLNLWSKELYKRFDLTDTKMFTLSDVTEEILQELEEPLTVKAFFTRDLPSPYNNVARYVEDQLAEMKANSNGNFIYEFRDPSDEEELKKEAESYRLEQVQVNELRKDKMEFKFVYLGMAFIYQDRQEVIAAIHPQNLGNLEYEILSKIKRITEEETQTIGFLGGHGEPQLSQDMRALDGELRKQYDLKQVNLTSRSTVPEDISLLCVIGPKEDIPEKDRFAIDQYIMRGGKVLFAINKVDADISQMRADRSKLRIDPWTQNYGFRLGDELVLDTRAPTLPFQVMGRSGAQYTLVFYPFFPEIVNFNRENRAFKDLRQVRFYFPTAIDTSFAAELDSAKATPLLFSSGYSATQPAPYDINPMSLQARQYQWDKANLPLGLLVEGKFKSYWSDKDIPVDDDGNLVSDEEVIPWSQDTRIAVFSDGIFIQDRYIPGLNNLTMVLNLIDWMIQDERLISIRSREVLSRPIEEVKDATRRTVKYANLIIPPLLVIIFGLVRWQIRKGRRQLMDISQHGSRSGGDRNE